VDICVGSVAGRIRMVGAGGNEEEKDNAEAQRTQRNAEKRGY
jgi:hypothetical protein